MVENDASPIDLLENRLGRKWPSIRKANADSAKRRADLEAKFKDLSSPDTSLVVFGSVARKEVTSSSDLDWILLIDGQSMPEHKNQEREIQKALVAGGLTEPGSSGVFGRMVGSHDLVHNIGGEDDLNSNTTRRVLLLLESLPVGNREAFDRVRRQVLRRYLEDDRGLLYGSGNVRIPRFLLNDFTRYWRTVTVDFVYKQRAGNDKKWALRNAKLRMSRKLVFAAGLKLCFFCHLDPNANDARKSLTGQLKDISPLIEYLENRLTQTPLEHLAEACLEQNASTETVQRIFDNYDRFLAILDDEEKRSSLAAVSSHADLRESTVWKEIREVSRPFHTGLVSLFLSDVSDLQSLAMEYGVF
jgi:predicted nucleotidyltransferase